MCPKIESSSYLRFRRSCVGKRFFRFAYSIGIYILFRVVFFSYNIEVLKIIYYIFL